MKKADLTPGHLRGSSSEEASSQLRLRALNLFIYSCGAFKEASNLEFSPLHNPFVCFPP